MTALEQRFWDKVDKPSSSTCWGWQASIAHNGYGQFSSGGKMVKAHRFSWELVNGPITRGLEVCHSCDNPACVNPKHLWLGTHKENMLDCKRKGRLANKKGSKNGAGKITAETALWIRISDKPSRAVAKEFGISPTQVLRIKRRESWRHV